MKNEHDDLVDALRYTFTSLKPEQSWYQKCMIKIKDIYEMSRSFFILATIVVIISTFLIIRHTYFFEGVALEIVGWTIFATLWEASK